MLLGRMLVLALCVIVAVPVPARAETDAQAAQRLHALFDAEWDWEMRDDPERATYTGDHRFGGQLTDRSSAAEARRYAHARERLAALHSIDRAQLTPTDRVSRDIMAQTTQDWLDGEKFTGMRTLVLDSEGGLHTDLADLLRVSPVATEADVAMVLARLAQFPGRVDQVIARLREGIEIRWVAARDSMRQVPAQIDGQLPDDVTRSPLYEPFTRLGPGIPTDARTRLAAAGAAALREQVYPAMRRLRGFIADDYLPRTSDNGAMGARPGGAAAYDYLVRQHTTTDLSAAQVHAIGLREMARLRGEMEAQMRAAGFAGSFDQFVAFLNSDPRFFHTDPEALLAGYRDIAKRVDPELPKLFAELPRTPYGIRAIPAHEGIGKTENYSAPPRDGSGAGWFNANVVAIATRPIWNMETLFAHEAVPGHHLQIARARELGDLPQFRRGGGFTAYVEGWALYAETLGPELGLYRTPYTRFGHLQWQALRAARLVVDTGIHAFGWQRQQAIDWMTERTGMARAFIEPQVDRYFVSPGQALSYMIGELKILELRDRARTALGSRFDIRRFHMAVLDGGAMPLATLERQIDDWIDRDKQRP